MRGISNFAWTEFDPAEAMADLDFTASPGLSGLNTSAAETLPSGLEDGTINWISTREQPTKAQPMTGTLL